METTATIKLTNWCPFSNASVGSELCWSRCGFTRGDKVDARTPLTMLWRDLPFTNNFHIKVYSYWNFQPVRVQKTWKNLIWIWIHFLQNYFCKYVINFKSRAIQVTGNVWKPADLLHFYLCQFSPLTSDQYFERRTNRLHILVPPRTNRLIYTPTWFKAGSGGKGVWW